MRCNSRTQFAMPSCPRTQNPGVKKPDGSQDQAQVMAGTAQHRIEGIAQRALEPVAPQFALVFHVADGGFDGTAAVNRLSNRAGDAAFLSAVPDRHLVDRHAAIAAIDKDHFRFAIGEDAHLLDDFIEGVAVVGITGQAAHAHHQPFLVRGGNADFDAILFR